MKHKLKLGPHSIIEFKENVIDRVISTFDPIKGAARLRARAQMAMAGGYSGASSSRRSLSDFNPLGNDANSDLMPNIATLRQRSRDLTRNSPLARGAINTNVTSIIGSGLKVKPSIDSDFLGITDDQASKFEKDAKRLFDQWAGSVECDLSRTQTFAEKQATILIGTLESGDIFEMLASLKRPGSPFSLKLQTIEADRVENKDFSSDKVDLIGGIKLDSNGAPEKIHVLKTHPGNIYGATREWQEVRVFGKNSGRRNILHIFERRRPGQVRGEPYLAPVIELLKQLGRYTEAELMAAVISGMFTVFVKSESGSELDMFADTDETGAQASDKDYKIGNGAIVNLGKGDSIDTSVNPGRPNAGFDPFVLAVLRQIGVALELPYEILIKHFTSSYSASRAALLEAWRYFHKRRVFMADKYCQPVYEAFLLEQVLEGRLDAPGFLNDQFVRAAYSKAQWLGRPAGMLDPLKENNADVIAEDRGWKTAEQNTIERTAGDWEINNKQRGRELALQKKHGTKVELPATFNDTEEDEEEDEEEGKEDDTENENN